MSITKLLTAIKGGSGSGNFGHAGRPGKRGGSGSGGRVMQSIIDLSDKFDFVVIGSAAVALQSQGAMRRNPNDLDVIDLEPLAAESFDGYETDKDPRESTPNFQMYDNVNGVNIQVFRSGTVTRRGLSEIRMPSAYKVSGEPNFDVINGIKVLKPAPLAEQLYAKGSYDDIHDLILGSGMSKDAINAKWYRMMYEEAHEL